MSEHGAECTEDRVVVFTENPENLVTNRPRFDNVRLVDAHGRDRQDGDKEKIAVWSDDSVEHPTQ